MNRTLRSLIASSSCLAASVGGASSPALASDRPLSQLTVGAAQVGPGYRAELFREGDKVNGQVTLDLCGFRFPSEDLRTARRQVDYHHRQAAKQFSNEVVRYRDGGLQQAMGELGEAIRRCPKGPVTGPVAGVGPITWHPRVVSDERLPAGALAVVIGATGTVDGKRVDSSSVAVYLPRGNTLSAVYTFGKGSVPSQLTLAVRVARLAAAKLR